MRRRAFLSAVCGAAGTALAQTPSLRLKVTLGPEQAIAPGVPWPYLTQLRDGTSIIFGHRGWPTGGKYPIHYTGVSHDGRKTWHEWKHEPKHGKGPITEGAAVELRDGRLLVFDVHAEHVGNKRFVHNYWITRDSFRTVDGPHEYSVVLPEAEVNGFDDRGEPISRFYIRRSMLELPGGDLIASAYGRFESDKLPVEYLEKMSKMRSVLIRSRDQGKTWTYASTIASDPVEQEGPAEPVLVQLTKGPRKGRVICVLRTGRENPMYQCHSDDEGATWSRIVPLRFRYSRFGRERYIVGVDPDIVEMSDGTLAMSYGHKPDYQDHGNFIAFSMDHGETWSEIVRISSSVTQAYTGIREVKPGELFVVYTTSPLVQAYDYRNAVFTTMGRAVFVERVG
jgi:hypothetical protein